MSSEVKLSSKYQIVIPKKAREKLDLTQGDHLTVEVQDNQIILKKRPKNFTQHTKGLHKQLWKDPEQYIQQLRDEWEKKTE